MTKHRNTGDPFAKNHRGRPRTTRMAAAVHAAATTPTSDTVAPQVAPLAASPAPAAAPAPPAAEAPAAEVPGTLGTRLRAARIAQQLPLADCARSLHLPAKVLQDLEADKLGAADDFIFQRGALKGYARFLGLPPSSVEEALRAVAPAAQPALVAVARTSRSHWLLQRYGTAATYIVLTAMIAVPLVFIGLRGGLQRPDARIVSLDQPAAHGAIPPPHASSQSPAGGSVAEVPLAVPTPDTTPFRASLAPFSALGLADVLGAPAEASSDAGPVDVGVVQGQGQHTLTIAATTDCWYEITDAAGNKIDSGMLHAGDTRTWRPDGPVHVTLGNAGGVTVTEDGKPFALASSQRANVARFDLFGSATTSGQD